MLLFTNSGFCQATLNRFEITSKYVQDANYVIDLILPADYDSIQRYPVIYCVDNWLGSKFISGLFYLLNFSQAIEPIIIVGIGNEGNMNDWLIERTRDLTPYHIPEYDMNSSHSIGNSGVTGGASNFLLFLENELIPLVETRYATDTLNRGLFGYSYGGLFGVFALINHPNLFNKYFFGSPSMWYNDFALIDSINSMPADRFSNIKGIFMSVGEKETGNQLKGFTDLRDCLEKKNIPLLQIRSYIVPEEDHRSAILTAYFKAFKYLY